MNLIDAASLFMATPSVVLLGLGAAKTAGKGFIDGPPWMGFVLIVTGALGLAGALLA